MTWYDALLVTLVGMLGALGLKQGLGSLVWGGLSLLAAYAVNRLGSSLEPLTALALALGLGAASALAAQATGQLTETPYQSPPRWSAAAGLLGGLALGGTFAAAAALSFPLSPRVSAAGVTYVYPSPELPPTLYRAIDGSTVKTALVPLWQSESVWRPLVLPDWPTAAEPSSTAPSTAPEFAAPEPAAPQK